MYNIIKGYKITYRVVFMDLIQILNEIDRISIENGDKIAPVEMLKMFTNGRSGAGVFMIEYGPDNKVGILKLTGSNDESEAFRRAYEVAVQNNMHKYIAKLMAHFKLELGGRIIHANIYDLAGDDIYTSETFLDKVVNEDELKDNIMSKLTKFAFTWNKEHEKKYLSPCDVIKNELSYRFMDKKYVKSFEDIGIKKGIKWIALDGTDEILPNPYHFFSDLDVWGDKKITCLTSYAHGDFQGNNIIITENKPIIIDFCDVLEDCNVFHDIRYLESITLSDYLEFDSEFDRELWIKICKCISEGIQNVDIPRGKGMSLLRQLIPKLRENIKLVVSDSRNVLYNPSFYLAGVACGLINMRKIKKKDKRKAALIYAAYNLKMFLKDEAVGMYNPNLNSCMTIGWMDTKEKNYMINLKDMD